MKKQTNLYMAIAASFMQEFLEFKEKQKAYKKEIIAEWKNSINYLRKKKEKNS